MTRGTFILIDDNKIFQSIEFNGDMYLAGHGKDALEIIKGDLNKNNFSDIIVDFNDKHHDYNDVDKFTYVDDIGEFIDQNLVLDFNDKYFDRFGSDFIYLKSNQELTIRVRGTGDKLGEFYEIKKGGYIVLNFGRIADSKDGDEFFEIMKDVEESELNEDQEPELKYFNVSVSGELIGVEAIDESDAIDTIAELIGDRGDKLSYEAREQ
jgi:hypothetical protein